MTLYGVLLEYLRRNSELNTLSSEVDTMSQMIAIDQKCSDLELPKLTEFCRDLKKEDAVNLPLSEIESVKTLHQRLKMARKNIAELDVASIADSKHELISVVKAQRLATSPHVPHGTLQRIKINGQALVPGKSIECQVQDKIKQSISK